MAKSSRFGIRSKSYFRCSCKRWFRREFPRVILFVSFCACNCLLVFCVMCCGSIDLLTIFYLFTMPLPYHYYAICLVHSCIHCPFYYAIYPCPIILNFCGVLAFKHLIVLIRTYRTCLAFEWLLRNLKHPFVSNR